jgi:hypothetical protein
MSQLITIHNAETNEIIVREMNAEELTQWQAAKTQAAAEATAEAQKVADKAALLSKLGITEDEAKLLVS